MNKRCRIVVVDDKANSDPFYPALATRLRADLLPEPEILLFDADCLDPDVKCTVGKIQQARPDLILIDVVLYEGSGGRPDLVLCDWLVKAIKADSTLRVVPLIYVSRFFGDHYSVPAPWLRWCFGKQTLISDEETWNLFKESLMDPLETARQQSTLSSLPRVLMNEGLKG